MKEKRENKIPFSNKKWEKGTEKKKKKFSEPELQLYDNLTDITFFTSTQNVSGGVFF